MKWITLQNLSERLEIMEAIVYHATGISMHLEHQYGITANGFVKSDDKHSFDWAMENLRYFRKMKVPVIVAGDLTLIRKTSPPLYNYILESKEKSNTADAPLGNNNGINNCPFCGGKEGQDVFLGRLSDVPKFKICCIPCGVTLIDDRKDKVIANWNRRTGTTADALIEGSLEQGVEDLHDQVRAHIRKDKLYDWSEAMTDNEMTYLENLLLTFNPLCPPGSIGYEEQARHIAKYLGANSSQHSGDAVVVLDWLLKQSDLDILIMNDGCFYYESDNDGDQPLKPEDIVKMYLKENPQSTPTPPDYIEVIEDHKRLVRELDEIINGKSGMAKQASLCDLVAQLKKEYRPTPPGIVDKLRESIPRFHELQAESTDVWNECCDTLATLLSDKGEEKKEEGK